MRTHLGALAVLLSSLTIFAADWPQWRGSQRDGVDPDSPTLYRELPEEGVKPLWLNKEVTREGRGEGWSSPVVAGNRVYFFSHNSGKKEEYLFCLSAETGEEVWRKQLASASTKTQQSGTPTVDHGRVYLLGAARTVRCLDAKSGDEIWARQLSQDAPDEPWHGSPLVADGKVIVFAGRLFALSARSGEVLWQGGDVAKEGVHGSPALAEFSDAKLVVAHVGQGETVAVDLASGKERWRVKTEAASSTPVIHGDLMITLAHSRKGGVRCYRISSDKAEQFWDYQAVADPGASPVIVGDHVYVQGEKKLACLALGDGKPAWTTDLKIKDPRYTSLIAADDEVFYAFDSLLVFAASPQEFRQLYHGRFDPQGVLGEHIDSKDAGPHTCTSPAIADGRLYLRLKQGVACYDLRAR